MAEFHEQVEENLRKWCFRVSFEKSKSNLNENFKKLIRKLDGMRAGLTQAQLLASLSEDDVKGIRMLRFKWNYPFDIPQWFNDIKEATMRQQLTEMQGEIRQAGIGHIDVDEYLTQYGLKTLAFKKDNPRDVSRRAREMMNSLRQESLIRMKEARRKGEPIKTTDKLEVLNYSPTFSPPFQKELMRDVIVEIEAEIRERVRHVSDPDQNLNKICQFHKQFLIRASAKFLSVDMKQLKNSLKGKKPERFLFK